MIIYIRICPIIPKFHNFPKINAKPTISALFVAIFLQSVSGFQINDQSKATESLRVMTWNLENYNVKSSKIGQPKTLKSRITVADTIAEFKPHLLLLQEVGNADSLKDLQKRIAKQNWKMVHSTFRLDEKNLQSLNTAILSVFPLENIHLNGSKSYLHLGQLMPIRRGILSCYVKWPYTDPIAVFCMHLKSQRNVPYGDQQIMRENEAILLRKSLNIFLRKHPDCLTIVGGDLNDHPNSKTLKIIKGRRSSALHDVNPSEQFEQDANYRRKTSWTHYYPEEGSYSRIDYFLINNRLRELIDYQETFVINKHNWGVASDHRPILMTINYCLPSKDKEK